MNKTKDSKNNRIFLIIILVVLALLIIGSIFFFTKRNKYKENLLLELKFDEANGYEIEDSSGNLENIEVSYVFNPATYMEDKELEWREGVQGSALLFDGNSTFASYSKNDITLEGPELSISLWVAPRMFEWDDPNAVENGNAKLTGLVSQADKQNNQGLILGYQRHGRLSFQVGTGNDWYEIWTNGDNLKKFEWNYLVATFSKDKGEMCLYLNSDLVASKSLQANDEIKGAKHTSLQIGRNNEGDRLDAVFLQVLSGYLDELRIYDTLIKKEDIVENYEKTNIPEIPYEEIGLQDILLEDVYRPKYHGAPKQNWMNEPHAPFFYNGKYHLFFQHNMAGPYWRNISWGHLISDDLVNWAQVKDAICAEADSVAPDGIWSGNATYDKNGVPLLFFTAGNDDYGPDGLVSNQNIGVAYPKDLNDENLIEWEMADELLIKQELGQGRKGEFRDPHIWQEDGRWYVLITSGSTETDAGTALLYSSDTLELKEDGSIAENFQYHGPVFEHDHYISKYGTSWEMPILIPLKNQAETLEKYLFIFNPAPASSADNKVYYYLGDFDKAEYKFIPDESFTSGPKLLDYGDNVFTGPSVYQAQDGRTYIFSIMQGQRSSVEDGLAGWAHTVGLTREITLSDVGKEVWIKPFHGLDTLSEETLIDESNISLSRANELLREIDSDSYYLNLAIDLNENQSSNVGIEIMSNFDTDGSRIYYDFYNKLTKADTKNKGKAAKNASVEGPLELADNYLNLKIYVDRSLVESFFNDEKAISLRAYVNDLDSKAIKVISDNEELNIDRLVLEEYKGIS